MKPQKIRLFIKPWCGWCLQAMEWLNDHGIAYDKLDVTRDSAALREMEKLSGHTMAPVIEVDGHILADFGADELETWWDRMGFADRAVK